MTNEKAVKHLEVIKGDCALVGDIRALDMAISALSDSNVGMSMSHRAIAKVIDDYIANHKGDSDKQYTAFEIKALLISDDSAENKGEWIPIEEREPEVHKYVMFTTKTTRREIGYKAKEEPYYFLFGDSGAYVKSDYILAWMELPEPYKAEREEIC